MEPRSSEAKRPPALEAGSTLCKVFLVREANTRNPSLGFRVEALKEAEVVLLLNQLLWSEPLKLLAKVIAANFSISRVEEEEDMLLLILNCVELAGTSGIGLISKGDTLSEITH